MNAITNFFVPTYCKSAGNQLTSGFLPSYAVLLTSFYPESFWTGFLSQLRVGGLLPRVYEFLAKNLFCRSERMRFLLRIRVIEKEESGRPPLPID
jgi:hypothetical protein